MPKPVPSTLPSKRELLAKGRTKDRALSHLLAVACLSSILLPSTRAASEEASPTQAPLPCVRLTPKVVVSPTADGGLRPVLGVHNIQTFRANRSYPAHANGLRDTYNHAPMLAYWKGRFYLEYLSGRRDEHEAPCVTSLLSSSDGIHWDKPVIAFPSITFPDGSPSVSHQRMGFYTAPSGRLYVLSFYGKAPSPNDGSGLGRAIREVLPLGAFGPLHFLRLNTQAGWTEAAAPFPLYSKSGDTQFVSDCEALLADKRFTNQWWEEERSTDGFYPIAGKALSWFHRKDGALVGLWKDALCALSTDEGHTWTTKQFITGMPVNSSKYWGQSCSDGRYALVFNPTSRLRHPLALSLSEDGVTFDKLLVVHGELPDQRFGGAYKNLGPQYVRGIVEGNGTPPDGKLWLTYSVNKEDLWVSRIPVPVASEETQAIFEGFERYSAGELPESWNLYVPQWAPIQVVKSTTEAGMALELHDEDPYDYARAQRLFPATHALELSIDIRPLQSDGRLEVELLGTQGERPIRLAFEEDGHLWANHEGQWQDAGPYAPNAWNLLQITINKGDRAELLLNGEKVLKRALVFAEPAELLERLSLRTGRYRARGEGGRDLPGADERAKASTFLIDNVRITPTR